MDLPWRIATNSDVTDTVSAQAATLMSIQRVEPDAALFTVPAGYKIVDMMPPAEAPVAQVRR